MTDYTTIDGLRIYYREEGPACENENGTRGSEKLPLVLLLHGWGSNTDLFGGIYQLLSSRYRVAAPRRADASRVLCPDKSEYLYDHWNTGSASFAPCQ